MWWYGDGAFGGWLSHEAGPFKDAVGILIKGAPDTSAYFFFLPGEDRERRQSSVNQKVSSHQTLDLSVPCTWTSQPPQWWEIKFCCLCASTVWYFCYSSQTESDRTSACAYHLQNFTHRMHASLNTWEACEYLQGKRESIPG